MRVLALVDAPDHVCCRYRVRAFQPALEASGCSLTIEGLASGPLARARQLRRGAAFDVVLLQRKLLPAWQIHLARRNAKRLIFDFDDAVLFRDSYDPRGPNCPRRAARFARTVRHADAVIAGNAFLATCAHDAGADPSTTFIVPTCIQPERYPAKHESDAAGTASTTIDLVWIGSSSTLQGIEQQKPMLERLGREIPNLRLRLVCDRFSTFPPLPVLTIPWREESEAQELAAADVGISWIPDDLWSRGKCGLKILQYQAAGLPVVANSAGVHSDIVRHRVNGFLADSADDWLAAIRSLASDPALRHQMGRQARADVAARYSVRTWSETFVRVLRGADCERKVA